MAYLTASVGRGGSNRVHDVAVVQTALLHLDLREGSRRLVFWSKPIDGRCSRDLERAIAAFQTHQGQRETAKLEPGGKSLAALRDAQRPRLRPLRGLEGTAVAFLGAGTDDDGDFLSGVVAEGMVIPSGLRNAIARLTKELQRRTRLLVVVELCDADAKGRFTARLMFEEGITWIDPASGRLLPSDQAPPEAVRLVTDCARAISGLVVTNRANMTLRTPVALKCLAGPRRPFDPARAESLGIDPSSDNFPKRVMAAIFGGLDGEPPLSDEERGIEVALLCEAMENGFPNQANCFLQLAQFHPDDNPKNPLDQHKEKVERLRREGKVNWVNDLAGDFIGVGNYAILVQAETGKPVIDDKGDHFFVKKQPQATVTFPINEALDHLKQKTVENFITHMYLDSKGDVTIGIGTNFTGNGGAEDAVRKLRGKAKVREDTVKATTDKNGKAGKGASQEGETSDKGAAKGGKRAASSAAEEVCKAGDFASEAKIRTDYEEVKKQKKGLCAEDYKKYTKLDIDEDTAREFAKGFIDDSLPGIKRSGLYPDFETAPAKAQIVVMDVFYTTGLGEFKKFKKMAKALNRRDWEQMNEEQKDDRTGNKERMAIIKGLLDNLKDFQTYFIDFDAVKGKGVTIDSLD